ncbi:MAG: glycosyltransferase [Candidatus Taylorbacteria bacterium]|nr:glycosyltransferase [Candidatus Taylorbacteria bacterium]
MNPRVSVIMPVYNSEKYLRLAIQSVLNQSFTDFELLIINDGSTDKSLEIIRSFADTRIVLLQSDKKTTIVESRNHGLEASRGEFIAPLDSDDIALKDRLKLEVAFLEKNPDFGLVGGGVSVIDETGKATGARWQEEIPSEKIPIRLLFGNCFAQSSLLIRKKAVPPEGYIEGTSEDYALWVRMLKTWKAKNLRKILLKYRAHNENTTTRKSALLRQAVNQVILSQLEGLGVRADAEALALHRASYTFVGTAEEVKKFMDRRELWLLKLIEANRKTNRYDVKTFNEVMAERFLTTLQTNARVGFYGWKKFWSSPLSKCLNKKEEWPALLKFFIKCLLKMN